MRLDLSTLPTGRTYEDQYQGYMTIFKAIAETPASERVTVVDPPWSWTPLLNHLSCERLGGQFVFNHCKMVYDASRAAIHDRTMLEVLCGFRPECVDALWKCDREWKPERVKTYTPQKEFIVTCNGSFDRPEVQEYEQRLAAYRPRKRKVVLVPCAADKPYPAPLHRKIQAIMPDDFYMMNATGVLGLIPEDLWPYAPHYDSGIPNQWRLFKTVRQYFSKHEHDVIVVYCDFYNEVIYTALLNCSWTREHSVVDASQRTVFVNPFVNAYLDLQDPSRLLMLKGALESAGAVVVGTRRFA